MLSNMPSYLSALTILAASLSPVIAQTWTDCNPMNGTCPDDPALGIQNYTVDFTSSLDTSIWNHTNGFITPTANGSEFTINARHQSPTIQSIFYIFFGSVEIHMKAASGQGIISSIVIQSDDLDEIDWEWMGGNSSVVQSNYFGKGNQTSFDRAVYHPVAGAMDGFHNYTTLWTSEMIQWIVDGQVLRTLNYADANGGKNFPQTPSTVRLGIWAGGDPDNNKGTIEWAGGETNFDGGPYTMTVQSAKINDFGTGKSYHWSDTSGSFESIKSISGNSSIAETVIAGPAPAPLTMAEKWNNMSSGAKIGVYAGGGAGAAALAGLILFCCIKQRRRGRADRAAEEARQEEQRRADAAYDGMGAKEQDRLPLSAMTPQQYDHEPKGGMYAHSMADTDTDSLHKYNPAGIDSRPTTPMAAPPIGNNQTVYHNGGFGSRGYTPTDAPPPMYNGSGFNFNQNAPSRSFSAREPSGYNSIPLASPIHGGYPQQGNQGYPGRSFSAAPQVNYQSPQGRF